MIFDELERINSRPPVFGAYTAEVLWTDPHVSERMLSHHLDGDVAVASRTSEFIARSLEWLTERFEISTDSEVLDLGCDPGLYANPLAAHGAHVVGVDFSDRSLQHARSAAPVDVTAPTYVLGARPSARAS